MQTPTPGRGLRTKCRERWYASSQPGPPHDSNHTSPPVGQLWPYESQPPPKLVTRTAWPVRPLYRYANCNNTCSVTPVSITATMTLCATFHQTGSSHTFLDDPLASRPTPSLMTLRWGGQLSLIYLLHTARGASPRTPPHRLSASVAHQPGGWPDAACTQGRGTVTGHHVRIPLHGVSDGSNGCSPTPTAVTRAGSARLASCHRRHMH